MYTCQQVGLNLFQKTQQVDNISHMPLKLTAHTLDRVQPRPPYRAQIAAQIRQAIATGDLVPDEELAGEYAMATTLGVDRATVRNAISDLVNEGRLIRVPGKRTRVAQAPKVRRLDTRRYAEELARLRAGHTEENAAFVTDHEADWADYTVDPIEYSEELASEKDREHLALPKGAKVMRRRMVKRINDEPLQIQRSAVSLKIARGTLLADPSVQPYPGGTLAELYNVGLIPDSATLSVAEEVAGREPNNRERQLLNLSAGQVWDVVRVFKVDGVPVEVSRVIMPMPLVLLAYETDLS